MPELPDILVYQTALRERVVGKVLKKIQLRSPFLVRTVQPDLFSLEQRTIREVSRLGKRIVWHFDEELYLLFHLMIAGRFHWKKVGTKPRGKIDLAAFEFESGTLLLTEASQKKRASLHALVGQAALRQQDRGGIEPLDCSLETFQVTIRRENRTLKRGLTSPQLFSGIGNAYSDEILHHARLSPIMLTSRLSDEEIQRLYESVRTVLRDWTQKVLMESRDQFP